MKRSKQQYTQLYKELSPGSPTLRNLPAAFCVGGGICAEGETLLAPVREFVSGENYARNSVQKTEIKKAQLGNDAGIIGAAYTCELYK